MKKFSYQPPKTSQSTQQAESLRFDIHIYPNLFVAGIRPWERKSKSKKGMKRYKNERYLIKKHEWNIYRASLPLLLAFFFCECCKNTNFLSPTLFHSFLHSADKMLRNKNTNYERKFVFFSHGLESQKKFW